MSSKTFGVLPLMLCLAGCTSEPPVNTRAAAQYGLTDIQSFEFEWPLWTPPELKTRTGLAAECLAGAPLLADPSFSIGEAWQKPFPDRPSLAVKYLRDLDTMWFIDIDAADRETGTDIGQAAAQVIAQTVVGTMAQRGLINKEHYDVTLPRWSVHKTIIEHAVLGKLKSYINEHMFTFVRRINGIDVPSGGIVVGIRPDGAITSLRFGGPVAKSQMVAAVEISTTGAFIHPMVSIPQLRQRFGAEFNQKGDAVLDREQLIYHVEPIAQKGPLEPTYAFVFHRAFGPSNATPGLGFRQVVGYSITDMAALASVLKSNGQQGPSMKPDTSKN